MAGCGLAASASLSLLTLQGLVPPEVHSADPHTAMIGNLGCLSSSLRVRRLPGWHRARRQKLPGADALHVFARNPKGIQRNPKESNPQRGSGVRDLQGSRPPSPPSLVADLDLWGFDPLK